MGCQGNLSVEQAAELAPVLEKVLAEITELPESADDVRWHYDVRAGTALVDPLRLCVAEDIPVEFG